MKGSHVDKGVKDIIPFYFRGPDDLGAASKIAEDLADSSPFVQLKAARMVQIECMARLLN